MESREWRPWVKGLVCGVVLAFSAVTLPLMGKSQAAEPCNHVVSYFLDYYQGPRLNQTQWRILDPSRGTDTLFLSLPGDFEGVRWDTTFDHVYFSSEDSLYRVEWRLGARPRFITRLPTDPAVTLDDLSSESWEEAWLERMAFIDTSTIIVTKWDGAGIASDQWSFLGLKSSPRRGIAFRLSGSGAPEHDWSGVSGPFYFVDLDRRSKMLIDGTELGDIRSLVAEHCGFLLIPGVEGNPLVIDSSGRRVFSPPRNSSGAVWVPRPRE
jgi:hypothetical protein